MRQYEINFCFFIADLTFEAETKERERDGVEMGGLLKFSVSQFNLCYFLVSLSRSLTLFYEPLTFIYR
jgi:hypothetical protein